jgi:hypothetical protein
VRQDQRCRRTWGSFRSQQKIWNCEAIGVEGGEPLIHFGFDRPVVLLLMTGVVGVIRGTT